MRSPKPRGRFNFLVNKDTTPHASTTLTLGSEYLDNMAKIVPPMNFGLVEDGMSDLLHAQAYQAGFYRSAQPSELNFSFLEKLNLKSVIWAGAEQPSEIL